MHMKKSLNTLTSLLVIPILLTYNSFSLAANDAKWFLDIVVQNSGKAFCPPPDTTLASLATTLNNYQDSHPEFHGRLTDKQAIQGLAERYPCQADPSQLPPPKIIKEQNGRITNLRAEGSLASTQAIGCIPIEEAKNTYTPADIYKGVGECVGQDKYESAVGLYALAGVYAYFDAGRITDKTAGQARTALIMNTFSTIPQDKKTKFLEIQKQFASNPESLKNLCGSIRKVGAPNYYPNYMILHGIKAFTGNPHDGALVENFDSSATWEKVLSDFLHCPSEKT
jgi:hypothetical protein